MRGGNAAGAAVWRPICERHVLLLPLFLLLAVAQEPVPVAPVVPAAADVVPSASVDEVMTMLDRERGAVNTLENSIRDMHARLGVAEEAVVNSTNNISLVRQQFFTVQRQALNNSNKFWNFTKRVALLNSSLELTGMELNATQPQVEDVLNASGTLEEVAASSGARENLNRLEVLNRQIWDATDQANPNNIDATEIRMTTLERDTDTFEGALRDQIRTTMVKRLRHNANKMRKALSNLGEAAGAIQPSSDAGDDLDQIGEQLGLGQ